MATVKQAVQNAQNMMSRADVGSPAYAASRNLVQAAASGNQKAVVAQVAQQNAREAGTAAAFGNDVKQTLTDLQEQAQWLLNNGVPADKVNQLTTETYNTGFKQTVENIKAEQGSGFGKLVNFALAAGQAMTLPGIGQGISQSLGVSKAVGTAIAAFGASTAQGQNLETALKNSLAMLTASQVPEFLKNAGVVVDNAAAKAAINSGAKAATAAALTGRDPVRAGLIAATSAGVPEVISQNFSGQGLSPQKAMASMYQQSQGLSPGEASLKPVITPSSPDVGYGTGLMAGASALFPSTLAQYSTQESPVGSVGGGKLGTYQYLDGGTKDTSGEKDTGILSPSDKTLLSQVLNLGLGYLSTPSSGGSSQTTYSAADTQKPTALPVGQYTPGSQALAQALRIGDVGAPIFGGDKEEGRRSGWNIESLRYTGNSEA